MSGAHRAAEHPGSWGRLPLAPPANEYWPVDRAAALPDPPQAGPTPLLAFGNGRSYGDVCANSAGSLVHTRYLDRFIAFDREHGVLRAEAGVLLDDLIRLVLPAGWFLPVTPGTCHVTLGGAVANDVHGKNHHRAGTLGGHVRLLELQRSTGECLICGPDQHAGLFSATVGGLGLTGFIRWVELQLTPVPSAWITVENVRFEGIAEFLALNREAETRAEHVVAWIDCLAKRPRGILMAGNHSADSHPPPPLRAPLAVPFTPPVSAVNHWTLRAFNTAYFHRPLPTRQTVPLRPFFYPLDNLRDWNRLYGPRGFFQYQCVVPAGHEAALEEILAAVRDSGEGSFLAVLKTFGSRPSPGMLSFPREGANLALDFPNRGESTKRLFCRLDAIVAAAGGRLYPAKDARMPAWLFRQGYPRLSEFAEHIDPGFSSNFWRRMME